MTEETGAVVPAPPDQPSKPEHSPPSPEKPLKYRKRLLVRIAVVCALFVLASVFIFQKYIQTVHIADIPASALSAPSPTRIPTAVPPAVTAILTVTPVPTDAPAAVSVATGESADLIPAFVTFYGWNDNGPPPGNGIAYPKSSYPQTIHETAGGTGTFANPVSFAANEGQFAIGERIYLPYLKKYAIKEDLCPGCGEGGRTHVDLWMESNGSYPTELDACEGAYTRTDTMIEIGPPPNRPVDTMPLFNAATGRCR